MRLFDSIKKIHCCIWVNFNFNYKVYRDKYVVFDQSILKQQETFEV